MKDRIKPNKAYSPFYELMAQDWSWVPAYLRCEKLQAVVLNLKKRLAVIDKMDRSSTDVLNAWKASFDAYLARRRENLKCFVESRRNANDPFRDFETRSTSDVLAFGTQPGFQEFEDAILDLAPGIDDEARAAEIQRVEKEINNLHKELQENSPPEFFEFKNGKVAFDKREKFTRDWFDLQNSCEDPINPYGFALDESSAAEQEAWHQLGLSVNPQGRLRAFVSFNRET